MKKNRVYSRMANHAVEFLGKEIRYARKLRKWSESEFAERVGVSRVTLQKIESGEMTVAIGLVLEAAVILGIPLFAEENPTLIKSIRNTEEKLALLPKRIRSGTKKVIDDF